MLARVPGVEVLLRGVWQLDPMGGVLDPLGGELARLVAVLAVRPHFHRQLIAMMTLRQILYRRIG